MILIVWSMEDASATRGNAVGCFTEHQPGWKFSSSLVFILFKKFIL